MKINWKVRFKNPVFLASLVMSIILPILTHVGLNWTDLTTWAALFGVLFEAIQNPVIVVSVIVSVWNLINDPTTKGLSDSAQALLYDTPKSSKEV